MQNACNNEDWLDMVIMSEIISKRSFDAVLGLLGVFHEVLFVDYF